MVVVTDGLRSFSLFIHDNKDYISYSPLESGFDEGNAKFYFSRVHQIVPAADIFRIDGKFHLICQWVKT
jgi:hypothetical protein